MLEIHRALRERGAAVRIATHGGVHESALRAAGVEYDLVGQPMNAERSAAFVRSAVGLGPVDQSMYTDDELRSYVLAEADYFSANRVTVAVTGFTLTALLSTRLAGIPLVTEHAGSFVPPVFERGLVPAPGSLPRLLGGTLPRWAINCAIPRLRYHCAGFNRIAAELGVEGVPSLLALLLGDLTLVPEIPQVVGISAPDMAAWRPRGRSRYRQGTTLRYTGPLYAHLDIPVPERVASSLHLPGPVIYVALTSTGPELIRDVIGALAGVDARILVAATVHDLADLASDRVMVESVLPSHLVMPHVDLAVVTGGQGSMQTAMASGTPALGIPLHSEQDLNVALLERHGAAHRIPPRHAGTAKLATLARLMLADDRYRQAAQRIQRLYDDVDGPARAAEAILQLATAPSPIQGR
ncbi:glycosyltransferase family 1 protein [Actinomadura syzygii]|uniref:Glycosyltransferase family 1 protein n=2 Tax=Actinomadura syzygii TaxID=1427538 RepID=A0A5D0UL48_9ACTN|nr:glycosyltransferase family 1 protein [Actinomadura syzygii]